MSHLSSSPSKLLVPFRRLIRRIELSPHLACAKLPRDPALAFDAPAADRGLGSGHRK